jgi:hypothetical protein
MAFIVVNAAQNAYPASGFGFTGLTGASSAPGDASTGFAKRMIYRWSDAFDKQSTPILDAIPKGENLNTLEIEMAKKAVVPRKTVLNAAVNNSLDALQFPAGHGAYLRQYNVLLIRADAAEPTSVDEIVWIPGDPSTWTGTSPGGQALGPNTPLVVRAQGNGAVSAHGSGAVVEIIGSAQPQLKDHVIGPVAYGDFSKQYWQRFTDGVKMDDMQRRLATLESSGDRLAAQFEQVQKRLKKELQASVIWGQKQFGTPAPGTAERPSMMGGIRSFIPSANVKSLAGQPFSLWDLNDLVAKIWEDTVGGDEFTKVLLMSNKTKLMINQLKFAYARGNDVNSTNLNMTLDSITLEQGTFTTRVSTDIPDGYILGVNLKSYKRHAFEGLDWHTTEVPERGDYASRYLSGQFTITAEDPEYSFEINGFEKDPLAYPRNVA